MKMTDRTQIIEYLFQHRQWHLDAVLCRLQRINEAAFYPTSDGVYGWMRGDGYPGYLAWVRGQLEWVPEFKYSTSDFKTGPEFFCFRYIP